MQSVQSGFITKLGLAALLAVSLAACSSNGSPTPPGTIGNSSPPSITETMPPDDTLMDQQQPEMAANNDDTANLPPANQIPSAAESNRYQTPASSAILTFEPMVGAPKTVARELSSALGMRVAQHSLPVVARSDKKATHRIKGYFTANQSGDDCVVAYVWDIFDASGKRINRVTGSQKTPMVSTDPWDSVKGPVLDKVAVDTAAKLKSWHASI
ncbi:MULTISPECIES: hypothetical protein [Cohaesibacter]|uniref:hypothetical protein n=1 Tax=Cohaesibacter TaxID=655352 RepID=UPI000DE9183C|nr:MULTISPECIES: hypothetical protein [Cohaesibacter]TLP48319.1 hypothetical protein FDK21_01240 [Cohaesibacter sp. CAU 1516]